LLLLLLLLFFVVVSLFPFSIAGVIIFDVEEKQFKTGIAHRLLRPTLGIVDPNNTRTCPPNVIAAAGFDVLCHSLEYGREAPFSYLRFYVCLFVCVFCFY
jgi:hypothetical protein